MNVKLSIPEARYERCEMCCRENFDQNDREISLSLISTEPDIQDYPRRVWSGALVTLVGAVMLKLSQNADEADG